MKNTLHILLSFFLTFAISFWEETTEIYGGEVMYFINESQEREEQDTYSEIKPADDSPEIISFSSHSPIHYKKNATYVQGWVSPFGLSPNKHKYINIAILPNVNLPQYEHLLLNTIFIPKFYILYHCPKSYLG